MKSLIVLLFIVTFSVAQAKSRYGADYFPNVPLTTQDGKVVHFYDDLLKGKLVAIDLIYTHCVDSCPLETARLAQVQKTLGDRVGKDIFFYSITIDPKRDTPEVLKAYAEKYHAGPGWLFLTGKKEDIDLISKKLGLYSDPDASSRDGHTPSLLLGNEPAGQWMANSALDNPQFLAVMIGNFMDNFRHSSAGPQTAAATVTSPAPASGPTSGPAPTLRLDPGHYLFATRCAACHTIGHGEKIGPDLAGITSVRERSWLEHFIATPDKLLAEKDPIATELFAKYKQVQMPNLRLDETQTRELIEFLEKQTAKLDAGSEEVRHRAQQ
jgi:protein SCO1